jgi:hypothetical protein
MKWIQISDKTWGLVVVPLHGRGNKNGEGEPVKVIVYFKPADPRGEWKTETIDTGMHMTHNFMTGFLGRPLIVAGKEGVFSFSRTADGHWNSREPARGNMTFPAGEIRARSAGPQTTLSTVEPMHGNQLVVYPEGGNRVVLTDQLVDGHALAVDDLLGHEGPPEIIVGWRGNAEKPRPVGIKLFTQLDGKGEKWRESLIDDNGMACEDMVVADLNADGKRDIIASGRSTHNLKLYLNEASPAQ